MKRDQVYMALILAFAFAAIQFFSKWAEYKGSEIGTNFGYLSLGSGSLICVVAIIAYFDRYRGDNR